MNALIYIGLLCILSYNCSVNYKNFRGSSMRAKANMGLIAGIGNVIFHIAIIWSFWHFTWWQPIVTYIGAMFVAGFTAILFQRNLVGILITPILTIVFAVLSIVALCTL